MHSMQLEVFSSLVDQIAHVVATCSMFPLCSDFASGLPVLNQLFC